MAKIRHIAFRAEDPEAMAAFFVGAFEMELVQRRGNGAIDLSDGTLNITILNLSRGAMNGRSARPGIDHMGFTVSDDEAARVRLLAQGAKELTSIGLGSDVHYEHKFEGPEGIVIDIGHWTGTAPIDSDREPDEVGIS